MRDMTGPGKNKPEMMDEKEFIGLLLVEDGQFHDEGRDVYFDDVIAKVREEIGTDGKERTEAVRWISSTTSLQTWSSDAEGP